MVKLEYQIAYSEVLGILKYINPEELNKIPKETLRMIKNNANNLEFFYDTSKTLEEQNVSEITKIIIAILFKNYWATPEQQQKIKLKQEFDREEIKKTKYSYENLFKKKIKHENENKNEIIVYKETLFQKIFSRVFEFFSKNSK